MDGVNLKHASDTTNRIKFNNFVFFILMAFLFKVSLDFSYINLIVKPYAFVGFDYQQSIFELLLSYLLVILLFSVSYRKEIVPSYYFIVHLLLIIYVPFSTLYAFSSVSSVFFYQVTLLFFVLALIQRTKKIKIPVLCLPKCISKFIFTLLLFVVLGFVFYSLYKLGFKLNYDLKSLYQARANFHSVVNGMTGYLYTLITKSVLVFFMGVSLYKKKYLAFIFFMGCEILIFGLSNHKAVFLYPFLVLFVYVVLLRRYSPLFMMVMFLVVVLAGNLLSCFGHDRVSNIFILRMFFVGAFNDYEYYNFFQSNPFTYFSNSFLSGFIDYPYTQKIPEIIGFGRWEADKSSFANTGLFGSGYMQMGFLGMLLYVLIFSTIMVFIDSLASRIYRGYLLVIPVLIVPMRVAGSADMSAMLISHGLLFSILLLLIYQSVAKGWMKL